MAFPKERALRRVSEKMLQMKIIDDDYAKHASKVSEGCYLTNHELGKQSRVVAVPWLPTEFLPLTV